MARARHDLSPLAAEITLATLISCPSILNKQALGDF
jgi:hypothetical protein